MDDKRLESRLEGSWFSRHIFFKKIEENDYIVTYRKHWWEPKNKYYVFDYDSQARYRVKRFKSEEEAFLWIIDIDRDPTIFFRKWLWETKDKR